MEAAIVIYAGVGLVVWAYLFMTEPPSQSLKDCLVSIEVAALWLALLLIVIALTVAMPPLEDWRGPEE